MRSSVCTRIFRVSYTGELSFEVNVASRHGPAMWDAVMEAGNEFGIVHYGTEAMHVLRAEIYVEYRLAWIMRVVHSKRFTHRLLCVRLEALRPDAAEPERCGAERRALFLAPSGRSRRGRDGACPIAALGRRRVRAG